jgi:hypothetical protein
MRGLQNQIYCREGGMTVFIIISNYLGFHELVGKVFSSRDKAEEWLGDSDNYTIVEREISE